MAGNQTVISVDCGGGDRVSVDAGHGFRELLDRRAALNKLNRSEYVRFAVTLEAVTAGDRRALGSLGVGLVALAQRTVERLLRGEVKAAL